MTRKERAVFATALVIGVAMCIAVVLGKSSPMPEVVQSAEISEAASPPTLVAASPFSESARTKSKSEPLAPVEFTKSPREFSIREFSTREFFRTNNVVISKVVTFERVSEFDPATIHDPPRPGDRFLDLLDSTSLPELRK